MTLFDPDEGRRLAQEGADRAERRVPQEAYQAMYEAWLILIDKGVPFMASDCYAVYDRLITERGHPEWQSSVKREDRTYTWDWRGFANIGKDLAKRGLVRRGDWDKSRVRLHHGNPVRKWIPLTKGENIEH